MKTTLCSALVVLFVVSSASAQPGGGPPGGGGRPGGRRPRGLPPFPLMTALDTDKDGKLSKDEIDAAVAALGKLDKDEDGKLSKEEIGWPPPFPGFGGRSGRSGRGNRGGGGRGFGGRRGPTRRPRPEDLVERANRQAGGERRRPSRPANPFARLDRNNDGKITKEELPANIRDRIFARMDANKDGVIDKDELAKFTRSRNND